MLAEVKTTVLKKKEKPTTFVECKQNYKQYYWTFLNQLKVKIQVIKSLF